MIVKLQDYYLEHMTTELGGKKWFPYKPAHNTIIDLVKFYKPSASAIESMKKTLENRYFRNKLTEIEENYVMQCINELVSSWTNKKGTPYRCLNTGMISGRKAFLLRCARCGDFQTYMFCHNCEHPFAMIKTTSNYGFFNSYKGPMEVVCTKCNTAYDSWVCENDDCRTSNYFAHDETGMSTIYVLS